MGIFSSWLSTNMGKDCFEKLDLLLLEIQLRTYHHLLDDFVNELRATKFAEEPLFTIRTCLMSKSTYLSENSSE